MRIRLDLRTSGPRGSTPSLSGNPVPAIGVTAGGVSVLIAGANLGAVSKVWLRNSTTGVLYACTGVVATASSVAASTPAAPLGTYDILVKTSGGRSALRSACYDSWDFEAAFGADVTLDLSGDSFANPTWTDLSGAGHTFTASNTPTVVTTNGKKVVRFVKTSSQYAAGPNMSVIMSDLSQYTYFASYNVDSFPNNDGAQLYNQQAILATTNGLWGHNFQKTGTNSRAYGWNNAGAGVKATTGAITTGAWHHTTMRFTGGSIYHSIDGGAESSVAIGGNQGGLDVARVGYGVGAYYFNGDIRRVVFIRRLLTSAEIAKANAFMVVDHP